MEAIYQPHKQVTCNVNAYVDEGIKPLIEELSRFDKIYTIDSCQGDVDAYATVHFEYGILGETSQQEVCEFILGFVNSISKQISNIDSASYLSFISAEWSGTKHYPLICISIPSESILEFTRVVSSVRRDLTNDSEDIQL